MPKQKTLKILHVLSQRPDSTGSGMYVQAMLDEADMRGDSNYLIAGVGPDYSTQLRGCEQDASFFVRFHNADVSYHLPGMSDVMPYAGTKFSELSEEQLDEYEQAFTTTLRTVVDRYRPDIIHSHHLWLVSSLTRRLFPDIPMVTSCHGSDLRQFRQCPHLRERVLSGCRQIDGVLALSETQKHDILHHYRLPPEAIHVVGIGYNKTLFFPASKPAPEPVQVVYAGKISNAKGVPWLLRALSRIKTPAWRLHLVGNGQGEEYASSLKIAAKLGERVVVHGAVPQKRLAELMREAHILTLPSFFEGVPLVVLEGLASGCRLVATDLSGIHELLAEIEADYIRLIKPPRLHAVDQPYREDEKGFEEDLRLALQSQINAACAEPDIDLSPLRQKLEAFTWTGIFQKVRDVYFNYIN